MEYRGKPLPADVIRQLRRLRIAGHSIRTTARISGIGKDAVHKYTRDIRPGENSGEANVKGLPPGLRKKEPPRPDPDAFLGTDDDLLDAFELE